MQCKGASGTVSDSIKDEMLCAAEPALEKSWKDGLCKKKVAKVNDEFQAEGEGLVKRSKSRRKHKDIDSKVRPRWLS